jgi:metal-responsive CopG/Arc/MetJ family transcriptional regulator
MLMHMTQFVTRIEAELAAAVDRMVEEGVVASRSAAVRLGLENLVDRHHRGLVGQAIVAGYVRQPQTESEVGWADEATRRMIAEEAW